VLRLNEAARFLVAGHIAPHELKRDRSLYRLVTPRFGEGAGDVLFPER
jgi:hypothetical protein